MKTEFEWNAAEGIAACIITDNQNRVFTEFAKCHDDDFDMISEKTGCEIAYRRAKISALRAVRDLDLKPRLAALKQLYYSMKHSSKFNPNSYENLMLQRQIRLLNFDLATAKEMIASEQKFLKDYIKGKDKLYNRLRLTQKAKSE